MSTAIVHPTTIIAVGRIAGSGPIEMRTAHDAMRDEYTAGRARFVAGQLLDQCSTPAERAGYVGAEADARRADLRAMLAVTFDEWRANPSVLGGEDWS